MKESTIELMVSWFTLVAFLFMNALSSANNLPEGNLTQTSIEGGQFRSNVTKTSEIKLTAVLTFIISLTTGNSPAGAIVRLIGQELPFSEFSQIVPQTGVTVFTGVPEGNYLVEVSKAGFYNYSIVTNISSNTAFDILLQEIRYKPLNLSVDNLSLDAKWDEPRDILIHENFENSVFPPIGWQALTQNLTGWYVTTDGSSAGFAIPPHSTYAVVNNEVENGNGCCDYLITPEMDCTNLPDYKLTFTGFLTGVTNQIATVEISSDGGSSWIVIYTLQPSPLLWQDIEIDLSDYSGPDGLSSVLLAFHADDSGGSSSGWAIDDVKISSGTIPVLGYGVFLDGLLLAYTPDQTYAFDQELIYGQQYIAGVSALYSSGYSEPDTSYFTSRFLFPPLNFEGNIPMGTDYVHLWWNQPENMNDTSYAISGLIGYNVYRNNLPIAFIEQTDTEYFDMNLTPGIYSYHLTAVYNLSYYGYPGQTGESMIAGPVVIDNTWCNQLPFNESFNTGLFETNQWSVGGNNWRIAGQIGNQAPSAEFYYSPAATDYSCALTSFCINGTGYIDGNIKLNFDLKHTLITATGAEFMAVEVFNGTAWIKVAEYSNIQNLEWLNRSIDITDIVLGKRFQVRFRAYGSNSLDIFNWLVDNINIYHNWLPPLNFGAGLNFPHWNVLLEWEPPTGDTSLPSAWLGWDNGTNNDAVGLTGGGSFSAAIRFTPAQLSQYAGTNLTKLRFFPYSAGTFVLKVWIGANASQLVVNQTVASVVVGEWNEVAITSPVPVTGAAELWFGYTVTHAANDFPAGVDAGPAVAGFGDMISLDGSAWESMATAYALNYNWNLGGYVESESKAAVLIQDTRGKASENELLPQNGNLNGLLDSTQGKGSVKAMRELAGYNIWRSNYPNPWSFLTFTTETSYVDEDVILDLTYCYKITAVYAATESEPTGEDCVFVGDWGASDGKTEHVLIYPIPAPGIINIEHTGNLNRILVYDYAGQLVYEQPVTETQTIQINVSGYKTGVYLIKLINGAGESFARKVVVTR